MTNPINWNELKSADLFIESDGGGADGWHAAIYDRQYRLIAEAYAYSRQKARNQAFRNWKVLQCRT